MFFQSAIGCLAEEETSMAGELLIFSSLFFSSLTISIPCSGVVRASLHERRTYVRESFERSSNVRSVLVRTGRVGCAEPCKAFLTTADLCPSSAILLLASVRRSQSAVTLLFSSRWGLSEHTVKRFKILVLFSSHISGVSAPAKTQSTSSSFGR